MIPRAVSVIRLVCFLASLSALAVPFIAARLWLALIAPALLLTLWIVSETRPGFWSSSALLALYLAFAAMAALLASAPILWLLLGSLSALLAWDLTDLRLSLEAAPGPDTARLLTRQHLQALGLVIASTVLLALLVTSVRLRLSFGIALMLALLILGGVIYGVRSATRPS